MNDSWLGRPVFWLAVLWLAAFSVFSVFLAGFATPVVAQVADAEGAVTESVIRDGRLFDPGIHFTEPAAGAPEDLKRMVDFVGEWDFDFEVHRPGPEVLRSKGKSKVTFMNRGHGLMERTRIVDFDGEGHPMATIEFFAVNAQGVWTVSEGNSWTETISIAGGAFEGQKLVLFDAKRPGGGPTLLLFRRTYLRKAAAEGQGPVPSFTMELEMSSDVGKIWSLLVRRTYQRRDPSDDFFPVREDVGLADPERAPEAAQFDFLLGEFEATHWLKQPQQELRWKSNSTGVHALDGHAILEFDWHNMDPSLPDAATTVLRIYNRSMRRWESLFMPNRGHTPLHFGGVQEGERIVLHPFGAQTGRNPLSQWIFFGAKKDTYRWKGLRSADRSAPSEPYWTIDFVRKGKAADATP